MLKIPFTLPIAKTLLLTVLFICFLTNNAHSQRKAADISYQEVGGWIGAANYYGDLNPSFSLKGARPAFGGYYRHTFTPYIALKAGAALGFVAFKDAYTNSPWQEARNLAFRTHIAEAGAQLEFNFLRYIPGNEDYFATPYLTIGVSLFHFSPKAKYDGKWYKLKNIGTEGQLQTDLTGISPYKTIQPAIPIGLGFKYWLKDTWTLSGELSYRFTFTDYIDDVHGVYISKVLADNQISAILADPSQLIQPNAPLSQPAGAQRGDSVTKDSFMFFQVSLSYAIFKVKCP